MRHGGRLHVGAFDCAKAALTTRRDAIIGIKERKNPDASEMINMLN
jgi:hypothetical protein